jgi:hypothetical protein
VVHRLGRVAAIKQGAPQCLQVGNADVLGVLVSIGMQKPPQMRTIERSTSVAAFCFFEGKKLLGHVDDEGLAPGGQDRRLTELGPRATPAKPLTTRRIVRRRRSGHDQRSAVARPTWQPAAVFDLSQAGCARVQLRTEAFALVRSAPQVSRRAFMPKTDHKRLWIKGLSYGCVPT